MSIGDDCTARLRIRPDPYCETDKRCHFQCFNFKVRPVSGHATKARLPAWRSPCSDCRTVGSAQLLQNANCTIEQLRNRRKAAMSEKNCKTAATQ
eukprot:364969-Chlamydomonas_euryale.AAC.3